MFDVLYSKQARKFILTAEKISSKRLLKKIEELRSRPVMHDTKTVQGYKEKLYRVRVGDCRILYEVDYSKNLIGIVKIDRRQRVY
ncbi:MAG: type II toxin-antitoxin system RelE/ParE family toxin [Candidatus Aenigmarchaeota archaeon]|nr:type II toxin-antitoxin system RelE/ParE family toxin [Candidatus Aenigmarchaeota archaeon]